MGLRLQVYDNGDHTCLVWLPTDGKSIADCRGFAIRRLSGGKEQYLHGFVGFTDQDKLDLKNPWKFPLQRYMWWDYGVKPGDTVQYSVVPVVGPNKDKLSLDTRNASPLTPAMTITGQVTPHIASYFNKGIVAAQWISRILATQPKDSKIKNLVATPGNVARNALSGLLRPQILSLLADAQKSGGKIFAALYELNDPELIAALEAFGKDCSLILANGAFSSAKPDENAEVRAALRGKINVFDRLVTSGHFAHNKFVVFCDAAGKPQRVLSGSTNWSSSGLCTQANNGLIIDDPDVAVDFLAAWNRMKDAGNDYTPALVKGNSTAQTFDIDGSKITPWFVKTSAQQDLEFARERINAAKEGILFLFFNPGTFQEDPKKWTLLQNILERHHEGQPDFNPDLYFCGIVNQDIPQLTKPGAPHDPSAAAPAPVTLIKNGVEPPMRLGHDVLVPHNIKSQFFNWEKELLGASMVNIHSKVIVLDPFGDKPVVMTGSHNLGFKASNANDDNLVIVEGNAPLAAAYAINIIAMFQNYRWNSYVEAHRNDPKVWHGLVDNDAWQASYLQGEELAEIKFWMGDAAAGAPAKAPAAPPKESTSPAPQAPAAPVRHAVHAASSHSAGATKPKATKSSATAVKKKAVKKKAVAKATKKAPAKHATSRGTPAKSKK